MRIVSPRFLIMAKRFTGPWRSQRAKLGSEHSGKGRRYQVAYYEGFHKW
jgi:hypothetical protein